MTIPVIIADDHSFIRTGVESVLATSMFAVVAAVGNGEQALAAIAEHDPAIAILDVRMPAVDGITVLKELRARGDKRPVVLLTAEIEDHKLLAALDAGVNGIVMKEGGEDHLIDCLEVVLDGGRDIPDHLLRRAEELRVAPKPNPLRCLNAREAELAWMVGQGMRNREIAERFDLSEGAVKFALHGVYKKVSVTTRTELALLMQRHGYA